MGKGQTCEIQAETLEIFGTADPEIYPLQKKGHTLEFREMSGGIGVFCAESGSECVDSAESRGSEFAFKLTGHGCDRQTCRIHGQRTDMRDTGRNS